jgi:CTP synthase
MIQYARKNNVPFLGICLGLQCAVIEFAKNVCNLDDVNSREVDVLCKNPVVDMMATQVGVEQKGGTMRLGSYPCVLTPGSLAEQLYGCNESSERHRHRFEVNNKYKELMESKGLVFSGQSPDGRLMEIIEYPVHPYFVACQFHPEFQSRPHKPHPLFSGLIAAALKEKNK